MKIFGKDYHQTWRDAHKENVLVSQQKYEGSGKRQIQQAKYRAKNGETLRAKSREYYANNKEAHNETMARKNLEYKLRFIKMYGGRCTCCGESETDFLTIEHINGQKGIKNKETGIKAYRKAVSEYRPDLYTILCWNCNCATKNGRACPHRR